MPALFFHPPCIAIARRAGRQSASQRLDDATLHGWVTRLHRLSRGRYGSPRITAHLRLIGFGVTRRRVIVAMRHLGLAGARDRRERGQKGRLNRRRTRRGRATSRQCATDRLLREFTCPRPNAVWVADLTEIAGGRAHLAFVLDLASRRVLTADIGDAPTARLATRVLKAAIASRRPPRGLIVHTDRGGAYASRLFQSTLRHHAAISSMSRRHNPWDNAVAESFIATLKCELLYGLDTTSLPTMIRELSDYLHWYNDERLHSTLGYLSPAEYELREFGIRAK